MAASIFVLHSIIPHQHANEVGSFDESKAFINADGLLDFVQLFFLTDLGEGHMETFDQGEQFDFGSMFQIESSSVIIPFSSVVSSTNFVNVQLPSQRHYLDGVPILRHYFLSNIDFRGPPSA